MCLVESAQASSENHTKDRPHNIPNASPLPVSDISAGTRLDIRLMKKTRALGLRILVDNPREKA